MSGSAIAAMVANLTGELEPTGCLPEIPDVLAEEICRSANRCWELLGRDQTRLALNRLDLNERRAVRVAAEHPGIGDAQPVSRENKIAQIARAGLGLVELTPLVAGLEYLTEEQLAALNSARAAMRKLREFEAPGGADRYVAATVATAARKMQLRAPGAKRPGRPKVDDVKPTDDLLAAVRQYATLEYGNRTERRDEICRQHGLNKARFYEILNSPPDRC